MNHWSAASRRLLLGLIGLIAPIPATAATDDATIAALQAQVAVLSERLEALEARQRIPIQNYEAPVPKAPAAASGWSDRIRWSGDFRYRHETIDAEFDEDARHRNRIRARPAMTVRMNDAVDVGFGLATGGEEPTSANQSLGGAFAKKPIDLDLAYFTWRAPVNGLALTAGKYKNPLVRPGDNGLLWDGDLRPEGSNVTFRRGNLALTGLMNWVSESAGSDTLLLGGQGSWTLPFGEQGGLQVGAGFYDLGDLEGEPVPFDGDARGNTVDALNNYVYGYQELEVFGELSFQLGDRPATVFANYVENLDADGYAQGWAVGTTVRFQHGRRPWELGYIYQALEPDAVFALFTDSDFIGGGTDGRGHIIFGSYELTRNISLGGTLFINQRGGYGAGPWEDYNRLMLDVQFKY